jgi:hypothetical protein
MFAAVELGHNVEVARVIVESGCAGVGGGRVWIVVFGHTVHDVRDRLGQPW